MSERRKILFVSILMMTTVSVLVGVIAVWSLYCAAFEGKVERLQMMVSRQAQLVETVARFDAAHSQEDDPGGVKEPTIERIVDAHKRLGEFGSTGEFVLGRREGERIVFLLPRRFAGTDTPDSILFSTFDRAEPMHLALSGKRGWTIGHDYRGVRVLAAYQPVAVLDGGLVAKYDMEELRAPFVRETAIASVVAVTVIVVGVVALQRLTGPMVRRIEQSEAQIRAIFDGTVDGIITIDQHGLIESFNASAERLFGFPTVEVIGKNVKILMPEPYHSGHDGYLEEYQRTGARKIIGIGREAVGRRKDGTTFPIDLSVSEVRLGERRVFTSIVRDITDRKRVQDECERLIGELEAKNSELERFAYTVSHDLKSPLITLKGHVGLLRQDVEDEDPDAIEDDLSRMENAADKMGQLLAQLLELSRIGHVVSPAEDVSLQELAEDATTLLQGQIEQRDAQVIIHAGLPVVRGDRTRLLEVVQNLLENALKYSEGQSRPCIEVGARPSGNDTICYVRDNGIGIEQAYHQRVFRLFEQLDQAADGTGVGLALVKRIVEVHGGQIWVESEGRGCGSTFFFRLPSKSASGVSAEAADAVAGLPG